MSARSSDLSRVQEIYDIITQTQEQLISLNFTEERFLSPANDNDDLLAEGFMNRVLRITEELGHISESVAEKHGFDAHGAKSVRNRLAHVYGQVDRVIIWKVLDEEFDDILEACRDFAAELNVQLGDPSNGPGESDV